MKAKEIPILMYHDIGEQEDQWCVSSQQFELQMRWLKAEGWKTISLSTLWEMLGADSESATEQEEKLFVLTFDDGRKGVFTDAFPLLKELGFCATVFVVPRWIQAKEEIPFEEQYSEFLSWEEVRQLSCHGFEIGSHSFSHKDLTLLQREEAMNELLSAEQAIEEHLQKKVLHFCYPYGKHTPEILKEAQQRYETAVSTQKGFAKHPGAYARQWIVRETSLENFQKLLRKQKISLCMIVKNEERFLESCFRSIHGLVDEIVIVDTGSTDATKEIAKKQGAKLYNFLWNDDFAAARNFSLQQATGDWILILDADEELAQEEHRVILEAVHNWEVEGFRILTKNYSNDSAFQGWRPSSGENTKGLQGWFPSLKIRLFQNKKGFAFEGNVHEKIRESSLQRVASLPVAVHHYGVLRGDLKEKTEMHASLAIKKIKQNPQDAQAYFELGVQYKNLGKYVDAETAFRQSLALDHEQIFPLHNLAVVLQKQGKLQEAELTFRKVLEKDTEKKTILAEAHFGLGYCFFVQHHLQKAAQHFAQALVFSPQFVEAYVNLAAVCEKQGNLQEAYALLQKALKLAPRHARACYNQGVVLEKGGDLEGALDKYKKAIEYGYAKKEVTVERIKEIEGFLEKEKGENKLGNPETRYPNRSKLRGITRVSGRVSGYYSLNRCKQRDIYPASNKQA